MATHPALARAKRRAARAELLRTPETWEGLLPEEQEYVREKYDKLMAPVGREPGVIGWQAYRPERALVALPIREMLEARRLVRRRSRTKHSR